MDRRRRAVDHACEEPRGPAPVYVVDVVDDQDPSFIGASQLLHEQPDRRLVRPPDARHLDRADRYTLRAETDERGGQLRREGHSRTVGRFRLQPDHARRSADVVDPLPHGRGLAPSGRCDDRLDPSGAAGIKLRGEAGAGRSARCGRQAQLFPAEVELPVEGLPSQWSRCGSQTLCTCRGQPASPPPSGVRRSRLAHGVRVEMALLRHPASGAATPSTSLRWQRSARHHLRSVCQFHTDSDRIRTRRPGQIGPASEHRTRGADREGWG